MSGLNDQQILFAGTAILFQIALNLHFALRKWFFDRYIMKYGWSFYALSVPAAVISLLLLARGMAWSFWLGGFIFLIWALFGYVIEYRMGIQWRSPIRWELFGPYVLLYLATVMFYWWPLAQIYKPLWVAQALLFVTSTILNVTSHKVR